MRHRYSAAIATLVWLILAGCGGSTQGGAVRTSPSPSPSLSPVAPSLEAVQAALVKVEDAPGSTVLGTGDKVDARPCSKTGPGWGVPPPLAAAEVGQQSGLGEDVAEMVEVDGLSDSAKERFGYLTASARGCSASSIHGRSGSIYAQSAPLTTDATVAGWSGTLTVSETTVTPPGAIAHDVTYAYVLMRDGGFLVAVVVISWANQSASPENQSSAATLAATLINRLPK